MLPSSPVTATDAFSHHVETSHHRVVFVFEVLTMQQISTSIDSNLIATRDLIAALKSDRVLPTSFMLTGRPTLSIQHLKRCKMDVDRMKRAKHEVRFANNEVPNLNIPMARARHRLVWVEAFSVDMHRVIVAPQRGGSWSFG